MMLAVVLRRLEEEQGKLARQNMEQPASGEFGYGKAVGMYAGLERAKRVLLELVDEKDRKDFDL